MPDGTVIPPTGKAFDVEFGQTTKWDGDQLIIISAFWDAAAAGAATRALVTAGDPSSREPHPASWGTARKSSRSTFHSSRTNETFQSGPKMTGSYAKSKKCPAAMQSGVQGMRMKGLLGLTETGDAASPVTAACNRARDAPGPRSNRCRRAEKHLMTPISESGRMTTLLTSAAGWPSGHSLVCLSSRSRTPRRGTRCRYSSRLSGLSSVRGRVGTGPRTGS